MNFNLNGFIQFSCWLSILLILWGLVVGVIQSNRDVWFAFWFFVITGVFSWMMEQGKK